MDTEDFWRCVAQARDAAGPDYRMRAETLKEILGSLQLTQIQAFRIEFVKSIERLARWDVVNAAAVICGDITDDGFEYFCYWLVSEGRERFEKTLQNPDSLADVLEIPKFGFESYSYAAWKAYTAQGGEDWKSSDLGVFWGTTVGEDWPAEETSARLPRLAAKYLRGHNRP